MMDISDALEKDSKKELEEYFATVCRFFRSNELSYWIGNPSVEITSGEIYLQPLQLQELITKEKPNDFKSLMKHLR